MLFLILFKSPSLFHHCFLLAFPFLFCLPVLWKQGWHIGESARFSPMWHGFDSGPVRYVSWVCCWFSSCSEAFSPGSPVFLPPQKNNTLNCNSTRMEDPHEISHDVASSVNIVILVVFHILKRLDPFLYFFTQRLLATIKFCDLKSIYTTVW